MAITAGGSLNSVPSSQQQTLSTNLYNAAHRKRNTLTPESLMTELFTQAPSLCNRNF